MKFLAATRIYGPSHADDPPATATTAAVAMGAISAQRHPKKFPISRQVHHIEEAAFARTPKRGCSAMFAREVATDLLSPAPHRGAAKGIAAVTKDPRLANLFCHTSFNGKQLAPPLTIPEALLRKSLDLLEASIWTALFPPLAA